MALSRVLLSAASLLVANSLVILWTKPEAKGGGGNVERGKQMEACKEKEWGAGETEFGKKDLQCAEGEKEAMKLTM